jgi:hypothetical protein
MAFIQVNDLSARDMLFDAGETAGA